MGRKLDFSRAGDVARSRANRRADCCLASLLGGPGRSCDSRTFCELIDC
jgi:hypothetical protein